MLAPSVSLADVAEESDVSTVLIVRLLRAIARRGLARPVANFLLEEEQRLSNERVRKDEARQRRPGR